MDEVRGLCLKIVVCALLDKNKLWPNLMHPAVCQPKGFCGLRNKSCVYAKNLEVCDTDSFMRIINQEEIQQADHEEAWVPKADKVKISTTNMRIDPTMTQKEETYQVVLDIINNTSFYKAFLAIIDVQEIFMLYKGELIHMPKMLIYHMHQPWRTLASIINKFLSGKTFTNDRLCQSRVAIIWGMFHKKNVDFAKLIWEDFSYQIDNKQLKKGRRKIIPYPRFTKIIINHFLFIHKSIPKGPSSGLNTIKDDGVLSRMKFVRIGEDVQKYGKAIPNTMLIDAIKQSKAYKAFIGYSTGLVPPKKTRANGSKGKQQEVTRKKKTMITIDHN
ncbi:hypothetical protein Tco_1194057 [Tanacetum coccineum]